MIDGTFTFEAGPVAAGTGSPIITQRGQATAVAIAQTGGKRKRQRLIVEAPQGLLTITAPTVVRTITALVAAGERGIITVELSPSWAFRLGAYIFILRDEYGLEIETLREPHEGGWHGRYVLRTPARILEVA